MLRLHVVLIWINDVMLCIRHQILLKLLLRSDFAGLYRKEFPLSRNPFILTVSEATQIFLISTIDQEDMDLLDTLNQNYRSCTVFRKIYVMLHFSQNKSIRGRSDLLILIISYSLFFCCINHSTAALVFPLFCHVPSDRSQLLLLICLQTVPYSLL